MNNVPYFNQALATVLRKRRDEKPNLTQLKVAFAIGSGESTIRAYEYGEQVPATTTLILLAEALDIEPSEFLKEITNQMNYLKDKDSLVE